MNKLELIQNVIVTLNNVDVRGKDNMSRLLGCISALEQVVQKETALIAGGTKEEDNGR